MGDLLKFRNRRRAHPEGRRIGRHGLRILRFEFLQFAEHAVVLGVRNGRRIPHVVSVDMAIEFLGQRGDAREVAVVRQHHTGRHGLP